VTRPGPPSRSTRLSYADAVDALTQRGRYGIRLGLERIRALLDELGNPQAGIPGALVAGTNGKGSVLALAGSVLRTAGYRVGQTPKPHLVSYRERLEIDGRPIDADAFSSLVKEILPIADRVAAREGPPTEFELLTAMIFRWFADSEVDLALVEVGLGGRLDATHAWDGGVAVVTNVALDHTDRLGSTIEAIAHEKAAIIERGDIAVTGAEEPALSIVRTRAQEVGAPLEVVRPARLVSVERDGIVVDRPGLGEVRVGLRGRHQAANVAVADALLDALDAAGIADTTVDERRAGYAAATWPGRLELLEVPRPGGEDRVDVLLDGAHNPAGAETLAVALDDLRPFLAGGADAVPAPLTVVMATMGDKDVEGIVGAVGAARSMQGATVIATRVALTRALEPGELARVWAARWPQTTVRVEPDADRALDSALAGAPGPVVVAGSLYLVGAARARLVDDPLLRDPAPNRTAGT
jgi:dihydrofolate synthase/folylpolyglutamate synthase